MGFKSRLNSSCYVNNTACSMTSDRSGIEFSQTEKSMVSIKSIYLKNNHDMEKTTKG